MRHKIRKQKISKVGAHRVALLKNLIKNLIYLGYIKTTLHKARVLKSIMEKVITKTCINVFESEKFLKRKLGNFNLINNNIRKYYNKSGGYIRIIKTNYRRGDSAPIAIIELI
jgi:large subunit ribosomal protein L17